MRSSTYQIRGFVETEFSAKMLNLYVEVIYICQQGIQPLSSGEMAPGEKCSSKDDCSHSRWIVLGEKMDDADINVVLSEEMEGH